MSTTPSSARIARAERIARLSPIIVPSQNHADEAVRLPAQGTPALPTNAPPSQSRSSSLTLINDRPTPLSQLPGTVEDIPLTPMGQRRNAHHGYSRTDQIIREEAVAPHVPMNKVPWFRRSSTSELIKLLLWGVLVGSCALGIALGIKFGIKTTEPYHEN